MGRDGENPPVAAPDRVQEEVSLAPPGRQSILRVLGVIAAGMALLAVPVALHHPGPVEPEYQGKPLGQWLRGHPSEYRPAVLAVGTNAMP